MTVSPAIMHVALTFYWSGAPMEHLSEAHRKAGFGKPDEPLSVLKRMGAINAKGDALTPEGRNWIDRILSVPLATHAAEPAPVAVEGYDPNCPECKGTGERDSGGTHPWGAPAMLPCDCDQPRADLSPTGNTALVKRLRHAEAYLRKDSAMGHADDVANAITALASREAAAPQSAAPQPTPEVEALHTYVETILGMEPGVALYDGQQLYYRKQDVDAALARGSVAEKGER